MIALRRFLLAVRWHWWTDETVVPEVTLLLRSIGWLVQVVRSDPAAFRSDVLTHVLSVSSQAFWVALLTLALALVVASYISGRLALRIVGAFAYIFWWSFVCYVLTRIANTSVSIPDALVSGFIAFWLLVRLSRRKAIHRALSAEGQS